MTKDTPHHDQATSHHDHATSDEGCCISRRGLLGIGALGAAGALLPSVPFVGSANAGHPPMGHGRRRRMLIENGIVLTLDPNLGDFDKADVLIDNGRIVKVRPHIWAPDAEKIDASGMIVMPGFVDTHRHMWQGLIRNVGPDDLLLDYLNSVLFGFAVNMTPEDVYLGDKISALSALNSGITTILDWSHIANTPEHTDAAIEGLRDSGIRGVYAYGPSFYVLYNKPPEDNPYPADLSRIQEKYFSSKHQRLTLALAAVGPEFFSVDYSVAEWQAARDAGVPITTHVGVGAGGQNNLLGQLHAALDGGLREGDTYIHCCTLSDDEIQTIVDTGGHFSLAIPVEMQMGHGNPPIQRVLDRGVRPSLSVDVETNQPTDMFAQMHALFAVQRAPINAASLFDFNNAPPDEVREKLLTTRQVLEIATIEGARANGLDHKIGTLTPGKQADIIMLRTDMINVAPINDPVGAVVLGMDSCNVDSVFVAGKAVKRHGALVGVDVPKLLREAQAAQEKLLERSAV